MFVLACNSRNLPSDIIIDNDDVEIGTGYPILDEDDIDQSYPITTLGSENIKFGPEFKIMEPVQNGDFTVRGTGPSDVPIILVNVSELGTTLGETIIDEDGNFQFDLEQPLQSGYSIGIQLGDISSTGFNENDFLYSDTYYERPLIGILFDLVSVK